MSTQSPQWIATARLLRRTGFGTSGPWVDEVVGKDWSTYLDGLLDSDPEAEWRETEAKARAIRSDAEKDREIILAQAYKESEELRGAGDAKAFRIYADAYRQDPKFFDFTRTMEAYKKSFDDKSTIVMSPDSEFFRYLKQR